MNRRWVIAPGIFGGLAIMAFAVIFSGRDPSSIRSDADAQQTHTSDVLLEAQRLLLGLDDAETGQRGYIITGQANFLEPYEAGRRDAMTSLGSLTVLTGDDATQQVRIGELRGVMAAKLADLAESVALVRSGDKPGAVARVMTERGKLLMDRARVILGAISAEESKLLTDHHAAAVKAAKNDRYFLRGVTAIGLLMLLAAVTATFRASRAAEREHRSAAFAAASTERLQLLVHRAPAAIAMFDKEMRYIAVSQRYFEDYDLHETGGSEALRGRSHYEVFPDIPQRWRDIHRRVQAGETLSAENDVFPRADGSLDYVRWEMTPWQQEDGMPGGAVLFSEVVTARKHADARQKILLELAARLQGPPREAMAAASEILGLYLGVSRVGYGEVDETGELLRIEQEYTDGSVLAVIGTRRLADLGPDIRQELQAGRTLVVSAVATDPRTQFPSATFLRNGTRAIIVVPLVSQGRLRATLHICHREVRSWTPEEVRLAEEVASHSWAAVEQARMQKVLEQNVEQFRMLANGLPTLCWMARPDGDIYWFNQRWYDYTGTTLAEMEGSGWVAVHDPDMLPIVAKLWQASLDTGAPFEMTFPLRGADGTFRPFMTRVVAVRGANGQIRCWLGTNVDVTDATAREEALRLSTQALRESEARLQVIFDTAPVGIIISEAPSGRLISGNRMAETIFRHPMLNSPNIEHYRDWVSFHPDGRRRESSEYPMARALGGEERPEAQVLYQRGDGTRAWVRLVAAPIRTEGQITGAIAISVDIDREVRANETLARAHDQLESRVIEEVQGRQLAQASLAQAEKLSALGQLAGGIAHDFNNVMQAVGGGAALIGRHADNAAKVKRLATMVEDAARRGASITRRLLAFARRDELRAEAVDTTALLEDIREVLAHTLGAGIKIELEVAQHLPSVLADRSQLETVLVNLATNARDAMSGGGTITFSAASEAITGDNHREGLPPGTYIRLGVVDTGSGMDAQTLGRVMEPFFTTKPQGKGTGLGLPMARGFAQQSGGALAINSEPDRGTSVAMWLPATSAATLGLAVSGGFSTADGAAALRVLLVDDENLVREMLAEELSDRGYDVIQAAAGATALALMDEGQRVDLLVSDLSMPRMDGVTLIREAQARRPRLPAILLTGYAGDAASIAVGRAVSGSFSLLLKPVTGAHLADRVATLLEAAAM
jgi:PAS domain S-box-containing protein